MIEIEIGRIRRKIDFMGRNSTPSAKNGKRKLNALMGRFRDDNQS